MVGTPVVGLAVGVLDLRLTFSWGNGLPCRLDPLFLRLGIL